MDFVFRYEWLQYEGHYICIMIRGGGGGGGGGKGDIIFMVNVLTDECTPEIYEKSVPFCRSLSIWKCIE